MVTKLQVSRSVEVNDGLNVYVAVERVNVRGKINVKVNGPAAL